MRNLESLCRLTLLAAGVDAVKFVASSPSGNISRADFIGRINDWQSFFQGLPGEKFALSLEDAAELAAALLGAWHAGKIVVLPGDKLPSTLKQLSALVDASVGDLASAIAAPLKGFARTPIPRSELDAQSPVLIIFTSGSTGEPCAIEKNIAQLDAELKSLESCFGQTIGDAIIYGTVSHQHIYGLLFRVLWPLAAGRIFHTLRLEYPEQIANQLSTQSSVLIASPAHLKRLPENLDWQGLRLQLKVVFSSGGPLNAESADNVTQLWKHRPIEVFGSSETGGIAWRQSENGSTSWQPLPGVEWRLSEEHLQIRSPHLSSNDWFVTQDRAALRDGNKFELLGRSDRIIKLEERRISLTAIENSLSNNSSVHECKMLVLAGQRERLAAVVVLNAEGDRDLQANGKLAVVNRLRKALETSVDPIAIPRHWRFLEAMPVDSQGKTSQRVLAELFRLILPPCKILQKSEDSAQMQLQINRDLVVFDGHFSRHAAVVPGVALIDWAIKNAREIFRMPPRFLRIEALKFQQVIRPDTDLKLDLQWNDAKAALMFRYESEHGLHANGRILFSGGNIASGAP